jgi:hypothetical protein
MGIEVTTATKATMAMKVIAVTRAACGLLKQSFPRAENNATVM